MAETVTMPKLGFDMAEGTLVRWVKSEGETVNKGEVLAEIETDKATVEVESGFSGIIARQLVTQGAVVPIGTPIAIISAPGEEIKDLPKGEIKSEIKSEAVQPAPPSGIKPETAASQPANIIQGPIFVSPLARKMASEQHINLSAVKGSGPGGRIVKKDIESIQPVAAAVPGQKSNPAQIAAEKAVVPIPVWGAGQVVKEDEALAVNKLRSIIGRRMTESKQQVPHFYVTHDYDVAALLDLRKLINSSLPDDQKISVNDFIVKAAALTLRQFPNMNASLAGDKIIRHGHINIGVAVSIENGLMTVVCKDADVKPVRLVSQEIKEMVANARNGKVKPEQIEGATLSISNLGMYDVDEFIAIINPPEAAILAVGSAKEVPVVKNGEIKIGNQMKITISCDHRITDGVEAARFMKAMVDYLETPIRMMS